MYKLATLAIVATSLLASPAFAESEDRFQGVTVGIEAGVQRNKATITAPGSVTLSERDTGFNVRGFAGYDVRASDAFVLGAELGVSRGGPAVTATEGTAEFRLKPKLTLDASARAGFVIANTMLIYGRVGYTSAKVALTAMNSAATPSSVSSSKREGGLMFGGGAELALGDSFGVRLEYRRAKLGQLKSEQALLGAVLRF